MAICRIINLQSEREWAAQGQWLQERGNPGSADVEASVRDILANVREKGDEALVGYTQKFDCPDFAAPIRLSEQEIALGAASVASEDREVIAQACSNIRTFHEEQKEKTWLY